MAFWGKNWPSDKAAWVGALSWWKNQLPICYKSDFFCHTLLHSLLRTKVSKLSAWLTVSLGGINSECTIFLTSRKQMSMVLMFDFTCQAFPLEFFRKIWHYKKQGASENALKKKNIYILWPDITYPGNITELRMSCVTHT